MRTFGLFFWAFLVISPLHAAVYKWVDSKGVVHFSDKPHPDAEKIELPEAQTYSLPAPTADASDEPESNAASVVEAVPLQAEAPKLPVYSNVSIIQPADQETIRDNQGYVSVIVQLEPELQAGDKLQLLINGEPRGAPQATTVFALSGIERGSHTIVVNVIDAKGQVLRTSNTVTIYMHRPRVGMVPATRR